MLVSELFTKLSFGPLSNLSLAGEGNGTILEGAQGKIINYANDALLRIYSKFVLREKEVIVRLIDGYTNYYLLKRFAQSRPEIEEPNLDPIYIMDALNPFQEDVIKILEVRNGRGAVVPLNDAESPAAVFTPYPNMLQVPRPTPDALLGLLYQAKHKKLEYGVTGALITLPETLEEALTSYIASQVFGHMNGADNATKSQEHMARFDAICNEVTEMDLVSSSISGTGSKFRRRGFV